jgi:hypothetical protein
VWVELTKSLTDRWLAFLDGGYNIIGDAPGANFNNQWWFDVGVGYDVTTNLHMSLFYEEYRALVDTVNNYRDLLALTNYIVNDTVHLRFALSAIEWGSELRLAAGSGSVLVVQGRPQ